MKAAAVALLGILASVQMAAAQQVLQLDGEEIRIQRDRFGVPHIFANSERALFYGNGYAIAQDRLWQMERTGATGGERWLKLIRKLWRVTATCGNSDTPRLNASSVLNS